MCLCICTCACKYVLQVLLGTVCVCMLIAELCVPVECVKCVRYNVYAVVILRIDTELQASLNVLMLHHTHHTNNELNVTLFRNEEC